ncbi:MAG: hypothetical protein CVV41_08560 [Candidatus Riflebacteria bacterium HGW-Riflebacteria-1]|jgi:hypothetical protein|nr:MAG: hypothetical protein CVV41_08560 [Candidatus Riflebacteria bacterium HGW-Riflebacteria-1]
MSDNDEQLEKLPVMVPNREVFEITRMGLPLKLNDNLLCGLVIVLAIALQIRLSKTFLAEGLIAFGGFIGYVAMRYWVLTRRYPEPGDMIIEDGMLRVPASVNGGIATTFELSNCIVKMYLHKGKSGDIPSSISFRLGAKEVKVNSFAIDLYKFEKTLLARGVFIQKDYWSMGVYALALMIIGSLAVLLYLAMAGDLG